MIFPSSIPPPVVIERANEIWKRRGIRPKQHLSEERPGAVTLMERRAHSDRCEVLPAALPDDMGKQSPPSISLVCYHKLTIDVKDLMIEVNEFRSILYTFITHFIEHRLKTKNKQFYTSIECMIYIRSFMVSTCVRYMCIYLSFYYHSQPPSVQPVQPTSILRSK